MKKFSALILALLFFVSACAPAASTPSGSPAPAETLAESPDAPTAATAAYTPGDYTATAAGHNGDLTVALSVTSDAIASVEVTAHAETQGIGDYAVAQIPQAIVAGQTLAVDTMTGATVTSAAILAAAADCLTQAGADVEALKTAAGAAQPAPQAEYTCDVVVAGAGAAGLSAAYEAAKAGAQVVVVEKQSIPGGSTARSGGAILAAGTKLQASLGVEDSAEAFAQFLIARGEGHVNEEKLSLIARNSSSTIDWLESLGATFAPELQALHPSLKPDRGHSAKEHVGIGSGAGGELTDVLYRACLAEGVTFLFDAPALSLILEDGVVAGLNAQYRDGTPVTVHAKSALLATGGYDKNAGYVQEYTPLCIGMVSQVPAGNVGDGLRMAQEAGAQIVAGGGAVTLYLDMVTGSGESGGLFVLPDGSRFMDESSFWFVRTKTLMDLGQTGMYFITDASTDTRGIYAALAEAGKLFTAESPEALAGQLGMDPAALASTVSRYNELCAAGEDKDFGKSADYLKSVDPSALYAIPFNSTSSGTFGGPVTDLDGRVLAEDGSVIPGLYAAGEVANGDLLWQEYPGSGTSLCICFTFGRIAGQTAAGDALN